MKFTVNAKLIATECAHLDRIINKKSPIPVLANVRIDVVTDALIRITTTDLDTWLISQPIPVSDVESGSICVLSKDLLNAVKSLDDDIAFSMEADSKWLRVESGHISIRLAACPADQFPETPRVDSNDITYLDSDTFRSMFANVKDCATNDKSRFTISGVKLESDTDGTRLIATDGHRLSFTEIATKGTMTALVPIKPLTEAARLVNCNVAILADAEYIQFTSASRDIIARQLTGAFPNYKMILPKDNDKEMTFDISLLKCAIKQAIPFADERHKSCRLTLDTNSLTIETSSGDSSSRSETVAVQYTGESATLGFTLQYLDEWLSTAKTGTGRLSFKDGNTQACLTIDGYEYDFQHILMPLRI